MKWQMISRVGVCVLLAGNLHAQIQVGEDIDGEAPRDHSGYSVSLSLDGERLAIGAPQNDGTGDSSGHVRIFQRSGSAWTQLGEDINGEAGGDISGESLSLSADGNRLAIGAPLNDGGGVDSGHARVYQWTGAAWTQMGNDINGDASNHWSGYLSLSADGNRLAVGAIDYSYVGFYSGYVRVLEWNGIGWSQLGATIEGEAIEDAFGYAVSLSEDGSRLAVGGLQNNGSGADSGHVRLYRWTGSTWSQMGGDIDGEAAGDFFGASVAISADGNRVAIGAPQNDGNGLDSGHFRVFEWSGSAWIKVGDDVDGEAADDRLGACISLSADGNRVVVGAPLNDEGGYNSGQVRKYQWSGSAWEQLGADIPGEAISDNAGCGVAISPDGDWLAAGATNNDGKGSDSGHVRVFTYSADYNQAAFNGLFYDSTNSGHGFDFNVHEQGVTVYYYGHTPEGERLWLISDLYPANFEFDVPFEMDMYEVKSGEFGHPVLPADFWGTITITMYSCDVGRASMNGLDGILEMNLERLVGLAGEECGWVP